MSDTNEAESYARHMAAMQKLRAIPGVLSVEGPAFVAAFARALGADEPLPTEIAGVSLVFALARLRDVLVQEGEDGLPERVAMNADWVLTLASRANSVPELLRALLEAC